VHGFDKDHWAVDRITTVIEQLTGVAYSSGHVWKLLRRRLHYRLLRPARRAIERDEQAIARWVTEGWPRICRNAHRRRAVVVFWTSRASRCCRFSVGPGRPAATPWSSATGSSWNRANAA